MVGITVMLIMMTVAAQSWTFRMNREMEAELIFRGEQYVTGLQIWRDKTGGFPLGDLKVLEKKGPDGTRSMRKLYRNPFDKEGKWQYLFLHPGGSGFINPCANAGPEAVAAMGGIPGQIPVAGMSGNAPMMSGGSLVQPATGIPGQSKRKSSFKRSNPNNPFAELSAMDPETFERTVKAMNLAIVGVVSCKQQASIKTYQGQSWLSNWAFTPLAQGEFGGKRPGGNLLGGKVNIQSGVGMSGATAYSSRNKGGLKGHGGGLVSNDRTLAKPNSRSSTGRGGMPGFQDDEDEDEDEDDQWRRDEEDEEEQDWRLERWRRDRRNDRDEEEDDEDEGENEEDGDEDGEDEDEGEEDGYEDGEDEDEGEDDGDEDGGDEDESEDDGDEDGGDEDGGDEDGEDEDDDDGGDDDGRASPPRP